MHVDRFSAMDLDIIRSFGGISRLDLLRFLAGSGGGHRAVVTFSSALSLFVIKRC